MADPFIAEIRAFPFNYAPQGWASCDGQLLPISQNTSLFSLLGTTYGGDGNSTFALPNLQSRTPMHPDQSPGLSPRLLGEAGGTQEVTLLDAQMPSHSHACSASVRPSDSLNPGALAPGTGNNMYAPANGAAFTTASPQALASVGGSQPHNNLQPYLTFYFCIALQGVYPSRG
jgi:microcystin-dependent protein